MHTRSQRTSKPWLELAPSVALLSNSEPAGAVKVKVQLNYVMGKRRRSVTTEVNESEGEDQPSPSDVQAKRPCSGADKWSCPEEMKSAVGGLPLE